MSKYQVTCWNLADFNKRFSLAALTGDQDSLPAPLAAITLNTTARPISLTIGDNSQRGDAPNPALRHVLLGEDMIIDNREYCAGSRVVPEIVVTTRKPVATTLIVARILGAREHVDTSNFHIVFSATQLVPGQSLAPDEIQTVHDEGPGQNCFARGTLIETPHGQLPIEQLEDGDEVLTRDAQAKLIAWIGCRRLTGIELVLNPQLQPVRIMAGALTGGRPGQDLLVSQGHRLLVDDWRAPYLFGEDEILVPAQSLWNGTNVVIDCPLGGIDYFHLLMDDHSLVCANGLWAETMMPDAAAALSNISQRTNSAAQLDQSGSYRSALPALPPESAISIAA